MYIKNSLRDLQNHQGTTLGSNGETDEKCTESSWYVIAILPSNLLIIVNVIFSFCDIQFKC
jgi:hypothetical protein